MAGKWSRRMRHRRHDSLTNGLMDALGGSQRGYLKPYRVGAYVCGVRFPVPVAIK
jgi:hypothetical protein